jgi:colicin import membrane protein
MSLKHLPLPALLASLMLLGACAQAPRQDPASLPLPLPQSQAEIEAHQQRAMQLREQAAGLRESAETIYRREDAACFPKILVNACRDKARASYIKQLQQARALELDASQLERAARQRLLELNPPHEMPGATQPSAMPIASPANPAPVVNAVPARAIPKADGQPAAASPAAEARAQQERERRAAAAEQRRQREAAAAAERARKARDDAERYAERAARAAAGKPAAEASGPR